MPASSAASIANVQEALLGADGERADGHALDDRVRAALHDGAVHVDAGVSFGAVADEVLGLGGLVQAVAPLGPSRKARAALAAYAALLHFRDDCLRCHRKRAAKALVAAVRTVFLDADRVFRIEPRQHDALLHRVERGVRVEVLARLVQRPLAVGAGGRGDDVLGVFAVFVALEHARGALGGQCGEVRIVDLHGRAEGAGSQAFLFPQGERAVLARLAELDAERRFCRAPDLVLSAQMAGGAAADRHDMA